MSQKSDPVLNRYFAHRLSEILPPEGGHPAGEQISARKLATEMGTTAATISSVRSRKQGIGFEMLPKFLAYFEFKSQEDAKLAAAEWLATQPPDSAPTETVLEQGERPVFGNLPLWADAEVEARRLHKRVPEWAWRLARETSGSKEPPVIDAETVYHFAKVWMEVDSDEKLKRASELEMELARREIAEEDERARQRELPISKREPHIKPKPRKKRGGATPSPPPSSAVVKTRDQKKLPGID